jgi:hypothetical protein
MSADYEVPVMTVPDARGGELRLVRHYTDGIMFRDPVKLVVYDAGNQVVTETPYCRDVIIRRNRRGTVRVFGLLYVTQPLFHRAWFLQDRALMPVGLIRGHCGTLLASLRARWLGYCLSVALCAAGVLALLAKENAAGIGLHGIGCSAILAVVWPLLAFMYGPWSPFLILNLSLAASLALADDGTSALLITGVFLSYEAALGLLIGMPAALTWYEQRRKKNLTEDQWLNCSDPQTMLEVLLLKGHVNERKLRLFAVACCRRIWPLLTDERARNAVEVAEQFADGLADAAELAAAREAASELWLRPVAVPWTAAEAAVRAVRWSTDETLAGPQSPGLGDCASVAAAKAASGMTRPGRGADKIYYQVLHNEQRTQAGLLRELFGPVPFRPVPFDPSWRTASVRSLARGIYEEGAFERLRVLADALEEAGCTDADILGHCRAAGEHIRGCWVLDLVLSNDHSSDSL